MADANPKQSVRVLLAEIVDYAGLFPPAQLSMADAVINYATYKNSNYKWMLGRFVCPAARLDEFAESGRDFFSRDKKAWKISALASEDVYGTIREIENFNRAHAGRAVCDALEVKASAGAQIEQIAESLPPELETYFEIPIDENLGDSVATLAIGGRRAKIRTGGTTANAFPTAAEVTRFVRTCVAANVPFKATAGLHHPLRCVKPLTYERDSETGAMHGFLNVFLATAFLRLGYKPSLVGELLEDDWTESFQFDENGVLWRQEHFVSTAQLKIMREKNIISFGSCSFDEPISDLQAIGIL